jgi:hypothetical protein
MTAPVIAGQLTNISDAIRTAFRGAAEAGA